MNSSRERVPPEKHLHNNLITKFDSSINIKEISSILGGQGGGGRKDLAQAGGKDLNKIKAALDFVKNKILDLG